MKFDPPKHTLSIFEITVYCSSKKNRVPLDKIPYKSNNDPKSPTVFLDLYDIFDDFFTKNKDSIRQQNKKNIGYRYKNSWSNVLQRSIITRMERGEFGTSREVENMIKSQNTGTTTLDPSHIVFEPFYLGLFVPKNKTSAFFFSPKRGVISLKSLFWADFEKYFRERTQCNIECKLFINSDVYNEWMDAEVSQIIATTVRVGEQISDDITEEVPFEEYPEYTETKIIRPAKPIFRNPLNNFISYSDKYGVTLNSKYEGSANQYDEVKAQVKKGNRTLLFPLKTMGRDLAREFQIELPDLIYGTDGHPKLESIQSEYTSVYNEYEKYLQ